MWLRRTLKVLVGVGLLAGLVVIGYRTHDTWTPWLNRAEIEEHAAEHGHAHGGVNEQVKLTPQAQRNLRLTVRPLQAGTYWRTIPLPGTVVDRPGQSDRGIVAPVTGVVTRVHHFPGDTVRPGEALFTLRLLSEALHLTQSELFKTSNEIQITQDQKKRLAGPASSGAVPEGRMIELDNQLSRLYVAAQAYRQELLTRGLTPAQIDDVAKGKFVSEIEVKSPQRSAADSRLVAGLLVKQPADGPESEAGLSFEVQELKVELGQQVQAGQTLCLLSDHRSLYVEGRAFPQETPLIERAAKEGWPVQVEFMEEKGNGWPPLEQSFFVYSIANTIDPASRTFAFFLPLTNQSRTFEREGRALLLWRFRPGQKVRLHVKVEKFDNVFVLPAEAVVREGPETYVFRQNGDLFERKPVRVVSQDRRHVVIANDGSVPPGLFVARNGATQINRVLKSGTGGLPPGFHMHADGSVHSNAAHK